VAGVGGASLAAVKVMAVAHIRQLHDDVRDPAQHWTRGAMEPRGGVVVRAHVLDDGPSVFEK